MASERADMTARIDVVLNLLEPALAEYLEEQWADDVGVAHRERDKDTVGS